MLIFLIIVCLLCIGYLVLMLVYSRGWHLQPFRNLPSDFVPKTKITVVIPARNEAGNIGRCIKTILDGDYPEEMFEVIVVDDHSEDGTYEEVIRFCRTNVRCFKLKDYTKQKGNSYKKMALDWGIRNAAGDLIVTTDADCEVPACWLKQFAFVYETEQPSMIVAPVSFTDFSSVVSIFQSIDFMTMQGITAAAHRLQLGNMSNGANLAFSRNAFLQVKGYEGIDHLASGDDYLLMMKMHRAFPGKIAYLKAEKAIVTTAPQPDWRHFMNQRIRWASKSGKYDDQKLTAILSLVYLFNFLFPVLFISGFFEHMYWLLLTGLLFLKIASELYFLYPVAVFFGKSRQLLWFPFLQPLHIVYIIAAGFMGLAGKYEWKGRHIR